MRAAVAIKEKAHIARPLPVLVPLIQGELAAGNRAGLEHYRRAGELLIEAREQVAPFKWGKWLAKNFNIPRSTAYGHMQLAQRFREDPDLGAGGARSLNSVARPNKQQNEQRARTAWREVREVASAVAVDEYAEAKQARSQEIQLHRDLALELIDIGFKALATRLHPDRGGSRDAMRRLNRVRDELKAVATTRRFE